MKEKMEKVLDATLKQKRFLLPLDLQQHATDLPVDPPTDPVDPPADPPVDPPVDPVDPPAKGKGKTFTQDDVNAIAAKEAKKAMEKVLKQLGVTDFETAKDGLAKYKKITEDQKTDAQKAMERATELETTNVDLSKQVGSLTSQLAAMKAGVKADSLEDVIVLANGLVNDDTTIDAAIEKVLSKYPQFKNEAIEEDKGTKPPKFTQGEHKKDDKQTELESWTSAFKF